MKNHIIVDIDGTIADLSHRLHHIRPEGSVHGHKEKRDWDAFKAATAYDALHEDIAAILHVFAATLGKAIKFIYVTGRMDDTRQATLEWLEKHELPEGPVYMRKAGDFRDDSVVKGEIVDLIGLKPDDVWFVLDDRDRVVSMWRERGFRCLQVAPGDF